ncbi:MAG TPA: DEAD/DEAH box helicase, partial [Acidimicrobiales bacterium]|nr:DEAD/DEAH box helicase [Acidimicrobiales bacterium]
MPSFTDLGVRKDIVTRLTARNVVEPFPIQAATIADALAGRDVCGRAPTGSGKTIAFGIPLVSGVGKAAPRAPRGLVLVPTRELANQVATELVSLGGPKVRIATVFGGVSYGEQLRALRRGADILVACPGRLKDLVQRNECRLDEVSFVVIDEADRMADMGFLPEVRRLLDMVRSDRQTLLFSATLDGDISTLIERYQNNPVRHEVDRADDHVENEHHFWKTNRNERVKLAAAIVSKAYSAIVFCRTKHGADRLATQLEGLGVTAAAIHGDRTQRQRERALAAFTNGKVQCLVATDIAARGIHVDNVGCVVHFDPPGDDKDYVHRSGRTGRAGTTGTVISLLMPDQVKLSLAMQRRLGMEPLADRPADGEYDDIVTTHRPEPDVAPVAAPTRPKKEWKPRGERKQPGDWAPATRAKWSRDEAPAPASEKPKRLRKPDKARSVAKTTV